MRTSEIFVTKWTKPIKRVLTRVSFLCFYINILYVTFMNFSCCRCLHETRTSDTFTLSYDELRLQYSESLFQTSVTYVRLSQQIRVSRTGLTKRNAATQRMEPGHRVSNVSRVRGQCRETVTQVFDAVSLVAGVSRSSYRQTCSISYRPITLVESSRMRATITGRVCASLYCSFTPLSLTGHIVHWVSRSGVMLQVVSSIPWWYYNFLSFFLIYFVF